MVWRKSGGVRRNLILALIVVLAAPAVMGGLWSLGAGRVQAAPAVQSAGTLAIVGANGARLYTAPGGEVVATLPPGTVLTAVGRSSDNLWVVTYNDAGAAGWAEVAEVVLFGLEQLPIMVEGSTPLGMPQATPVEVVLPTPTPTPPPTATPTPSPTPTPMPTPTVTPLPTATQPGAAVARGQQAMPGMTSLVAVVRGGGAQLYDRPAGTATQTLATGVALTVWGRSADGQWLVVTDPRGASGWVRLNQIVIFNTAELPVLDGSTAVGSGTQTSLPVATAVPVEEAQPTPAVVQPVATPAVGGSGGTITARVAVTDARLNIRTGPGTEFRILAKADPGDSFVALARNAASTWIEIAVPGAGDGVGWVAAEFVTLSRTVTELPISARATAAPQPIAPSVATPAPALRAQGAETGLSGRLVFQGTRGGTIYVYDLSTGALRPLTGGFDPAISPDGRTVAFTRIGGEQGLYLIDIDGRNERRIFTGDESPRAPAWSPDGRWIAFVRTTGSTACRDVGFGLCLPDNPFLSGFPLVRRPEFGLSRVDINGENFRDIPALNSVQAPDWTAQGIVYHAASGIEVTSDTPDAETRSVIQGAFYQDPAWQPGGDRIVFQRREGSHWQLFVVNPDGTGLAALTRPVTTLVDELPSSVAPAWSPDGRWIVYLSNRDDDNSAGPWRLWVMDADGGNARPLPIDVPIEYGFGAEQVVSWGRGG